MSPVPPFTDAHEALRAEMRAFVETELRPHAAEWEAARHFPDDVFAKLAARGWLGLKYGEDADWVADATFITNGVRADFYVTAVKTREEGGHGGLSFLVIEAGEGVRASPLEKLGWHASDTAEIAFDDGAVPHGALLGEEGRGFSLIVATSSGSGC